MSRHVRMLTCAVGRRSVESLVKMICLNCRLDVGVGAVELMKGNVVVACVDVDVDYTFAQLIIRHIFHQMPGNSRAKLLLGKIVSLECNLCRAGVAAWVAKLVAGKFVGKKTSV